MKLLVGLLGVAVMLFVFTLQDEDEKGPRVCTSCGVQAMYPQYTGHGKPTTWSCVRCGHVKT